MLNSLSNFITEYNKVVLDTRFRDLNKSLPFPLFKHSKDIDRWKIAYDKREKINIEF